MTEDAQPQDELLAIPEDTPEMQLKKFIENIYQGDSIKISVVYDEIKMRRRANVSIKFATLYNNTLEQVTNGEEIDFGKMWFSNLIDSLIKVEEMRKLIREKETNNTGYPGYNNTRLVLLRLLGELGNYYLQPGQEVTPDKVQDKAFGYLSSLLEEQSVIQQSRDPLFQKPTLI
jgi:hypothetical protein